LFVSCCGEAAKPHNTSSGEGSANSEAETFILKGVNNLTIKKMNWTSKGKQHVKKKGLHKKNESLTRSSVTDPAGTSDGCSDAVVSK
jgi:hypothetical protein